MTTVNHLAALITEDPDEYMDLADPSVCNGLLSEWSVPKLQAGEYGDPGNLDQAAMDADAEWTNVGGLTGPTRVHKSVQDTGTAEPAALKKLAQDGKEALNAMLTASPEEWQESQREARAILDELGGPAAALHKLADHVSVSTGRESLAIDVALGQAVLRILDKCGSTIWYFCDSWCRPSMAS